jgi:large subunit ribosomal protein L14
MIQKQTYLTVADNTGAKEAMCISVPGGTKRRYARVGDVITVAVKFAAPRGMVRQHSVERAVVVRTRGLIRRRDGTGVRFSDNACVILEGMAPKGTRIFGPVARELRARGFRGIVSKAAEVL